MAPVHQTIMLASEHSALEIASWAAQIAIAAIAFIAAIVAVFQLNEMGDYRKQRLSIANATLLMELDHRFDSKEMIEARKLFMSMRDEISAAVSSDNLLSNEQDKMDKMEEQWTKRLSMMRKEDSEGYASLLSIGAFFETVGMMVKRKYISKVDALGLFEGPIILFGRNFSKHIAARQNEMGVPAGFFEHALYLYQLAIKADAEPETPSKLCRLIPWGCKD